MRYLTKGKKERKNVHKEAHTKCSWPSLSEKKTSYKLPCLTFPKRITPMPQITDQSYSSKWLISTCPPDAHLDRCLGERPAPLSPPCLLVPIGRSDWVYQRDTLFTEKRQKMLADCTGDKQPHETGANSSEDDQVRLLQQWNNYT